jgi:hypothetical protein
MPVKSRGIDRSYCPDLYEDGNGNGEQDGKYH